ncbi:MAG: FeoA family protein [Thomasclavelia sp.]|mgnify:CR=1 FL=1|uniref:FeoA family protein n=1 Tax=Thomasclavelia sp. TaxID=3025757 RepID=UPI0039A2C5C8
MIKNICLNDLKMGEMGIITSLSAQGTIKRRLLDIGLVDNTEVQCILDSPSKDPKAFLIRGAVIALRNEDCQNVLIRKDVENYGLN